MDIRLTGPFTRFRPAPGLPGPEEIHFWLEDFRSWEDPSPADHETLSPDEKLRAEKFHFPRDRRRYLLARKFIRLACARYLGANSGDIRFSLGRYGKPRLISPFSGAPDLRFNISHSSDVLLAAFAVGLEVGADIETSNSRLDVAGMAEVCCSPNERDRLQRLDLAVRLPAFLRNWTLKEAYTKALGVGHQQPFQEIEASLLPSEPLFVTHQASADKPAGNWLAFEPDLAPLEGYMAAIVGQRS